MKYRKKPIIIEAFRLGQRGQPTPAPAWFGSPNHDNITEDGILIQTLEGVMLARWGDWIIKGAKGEFYPVKDEIFREVYEPVNEDAS
jgi:hypothetical protein